jgi:hypothetical protein
MAIRCPAPLPLGRARFAASARRPAGGAVGGSPVTAGPRAASHAADPIFLSTVRGLYKLKPVRNSVGITISIAKDGAELNEVGRTEVRFQNPRLVGIVVCSHKADASDTVVFSKCQRNN